MYNWIFSTTGLVLDFVLHVYKMSYLRSWIKAENLNLAMFAHLNIAYKRTALNNLKWLIFNGHRKKENGGIIQAVLCILSNEQADLSDL